MADKADWLTPAELEAIAAACRALASVDDEHIGIGHVPITDSNGEELGFIESAPSENYPHFVPSKWRSDDD